MSADVKFHPLAGIFPLMEGAEFDELALVRALGEDRVQAILDEAFAGADFRPLHAEVV